MDDRRQVERSFAKAEGMERRREGREVKEIGRELRCVWRTYLLPERNAIPVFCKGVLIKTEDSRKEGGRGGETAHSAGIPSSS